MTGGRRLYVYAVLADRSFPVGDLGTGIDGEPLRRVRSGGLCAVVHDHRGEPYSGDDESVRRRVLQHHETIDRLWERERAVLPMTFDVVVAGAQEVSATARLEAWLLGAHQAIEDRLAAVAGHVELRVDLLVDVEQASRDQPEVQALRVRMQTESAGLQRLTRKRLSRLERDLAERLAEDVSAEARPRLARWSSELMESSAPAADQGLIGAVGLSLLVPEQLSDHVGEELSSLAASWPALRVRFLGPWAPYSFADITPGAPDPRGVHR